MLSFAMTKAVFQPFRMPPFVILYLCLLGGQNVVGCLRAGVRASIEKLNYFSEFITLEVPPNIQYSTCERPGRLPFSGFRSLSGDAVV
jgi:hypothetical protein